MRIRIDGELFEVSAVHGNMIETDGGDFHVFVTAEDAGDAAREYWADMAKTDPEEFRCMVGDETLIAWCLGQSAGPGSTHVRSLSAWLDLWLNTPEEHFASYDGNERDVDRFGTVARELGFSPSVAYRCN